MDRENFSSTGRMNKKPVIKKKIAIRNMALNLQRSTINSPIAGPIAIPSIGIMPKKPSPSFSLSPDDRSAAMVKAAMKPNAMLAPKSKRNNTSTG